MPNLTVNNNTYAYPDQGSEPGWGSDATDWASDVTEVLDSLQGTGSISETQSIIELTASNKEINGLLFDNSIVESANVVYRIYRVTDTTEVSEEGRLNLVYVPSTPEKWFISREVTSGNNALVNIDVDTTGQVIYTATSISGANYSGYIKFKTSAILRT
jgi:hypothetical protein